MEYSIAELELAIWMKVTFTFRGAMIFADDSGNTFLGIVEDEFVADSIFNEYGRYGCSYSSDSIWNEYGQFGGEYSPLSAFNEYSTTPPFVVKNKKIIARLTVNDYVPGAIDPNWLKYYFKF